MACGVGVCLGCVIPTSQGNLRCCKDGPVFDSKILSFPKPEGSRIAAKLAQAQNGSQGAGTAGQAGNNSAGQAGIGSGMQAQNAAAAGSTAQTGSAPKNGTSVALQELSLTPDLSVTVKGVKFKNPMIGSSGTFGFGTEYAPIFDVNRLGGISSKGLTLEPRQGNSGIRVWETPSGLMNSIGLQNPGIPHFIEHELPEMMKLDAVTIANLSGSSLESYVEGAKLLEKTDVPVIELNISCPNVSAGGASFGMSCSSASTVVTAVRAVTRKPLWVKLTPQSPELNQVALACIEAGADAISLCNSFQGVAIDIESGRPVFDKIKAGFGGPAVRPIAVRLIYELYEAIQSLPAEKQVPIVAIGGVAQWQDVVEFVMAGASLVQVGTNTFANPFTMIECIDGLEAYMKRKGISSLDQIRGIAHNN
ncbi:MAG: dihydroorotate dehydrogenase [Treponema sp.]|nr:dihydroorotate dehydrogenase [Treponema sp.]